MAILNKEFLKNRYIANYHVEESQSGMRLDQFLKIYLPTFSREQIKEQIKEKHVVIHNRPGVHKPNTKLYHDDIVTFTIVEDHHEDELWQGELLNLQRTPETIYQDEDIIICLKPAFMSTHPTGKHLFNCATVYFENLNKKTIHSVHRLDRETSGILILARNPKTATKITTLFEQSLVKKCYFLIGVKKKKNIDSTLIAKERLGGVKSGLKRVYINFYCENSMEGKKAETTYKKLWENEKYIISLAFPKTGRQHQIRVHAMAHGFPLLGDKLYLGSFKMFQRFKDHYAGPLDFKLMQIPRHALHAIALHFPYKEKTQTFISTIPLDLENWIKTNIEIDFEQLNIDITKNIKNYFK